MGIFQMSLINQMLQDLEGRRVGSTAAGGLQGHVRVVTAQRSTSRTIWWFFALAVVLLLAAAAWFVLRTKPVAEIKLQPDFLSLKIAPDLIAASEPIAPASAIEDKPVTLPAIEAATVPAPALVPVQPNVATVKEIPQTVAAPAVTEPVPATTPAPKQKTTSSEPKTAHVVAPPANINKEIKELTPQQRAENEYRKATLALQQGKMNEAQGELEQAISLDPAHVAARQALVGVLLENKRQDEAVRRLQDGLNLDPHQSGLAMILARLQLERGELDPAIATLERTLPYAGERADYQAFLAALMQRQSRHKDAIEHFSIALRKNPQNGVWWMGMGISLQAEKRTQEARDAFNQAKATNSLSPDLFAFVEQRLSQLK
jgi:MSHA biogenesis protein MshN